MNEISAVWRAGAAKNKLNSSCFAQKFDFWENSSQATQSPAKISSHAFTECGNAVDSSLSPWEMISTTTFRLAVKRDPTSYYFAAEWVDIRENHRQETSRLGVRAFVANLWYPPSSHSFTPSSASPNKWTPSPLLTALHQRCCHQQPPLPFVAPRRRLCRTALMIVLNTERKLRLQIAQGQNFLLFRRNTPCRKLRDLVLGRDHCLLRPSRESNVWTSAH